MKEMEEDGTVSKFVPIDFNDEAAVFDKCLAAIKDIEKVPPCSTARNIGTLEECSNENSCSATLVVGRRGGCRLLSEDCNFI